MNTANEAFYKTFKVIPVATEGRLIYELGDGQWNIPKLRELLEDVLPRKSSFDNFEITHDFATIGRRTMLLNARKLSDAEGRPARILLGIQDITEVLQYQTAVRESQTRYQALVDASAQIVWTTDCHRCSGGRFAFVAGIHRADVRAMERFWLARHAPS